MHYSNQTMFKCQMACMLISILRFSVVSMSILANASSCIAQVIIDAPPTVLGDNFQVNSGEILNVADGVDAADGFGFIGVNDGGIANITGGILGRVSVNSGGVVNISEGNVGLGPFHVSTFHAASGSQANISGGTLGDEFIANFGSEVNISGGTFGREFEAALGSDVELFGGEFRVNGIEYTDSTITLERFVDRESVFTGTLADGSAFIFSPLAGRFGDNLEGTVTLTSVTLPDPDLTPQFVSSPVTNGPSGLRAGQTLTLQSGGQLRNNFAAIDASLNIEGGTVGDSLEVAGSNVNISGGSIGGFFYAYSGSQVNIAGGSVGFRFEAFDSNVNIDGGSVGSIFIAHPGTELRVTDGRVGGISARPGSKVLLSGGNTGMNLHRSLLASSGSEVVITGGALGQAFSANEGSDVELVGGEFQLNGTEYTASSVTLDAGDIFTGTLADGSSFIFSPLNGDDLQRVTLTGSQLSPPDLTPRVVNATISNGPYGLRAGQTLTVQTGGELPSNFPVVNSTLNVSGGAVGGGVEVVDSMVNLTSGALGTGLNQSPLVTNLFSSGLSVLHSVVNISGGVLGERSNALLGSVVNISGGLIESKFNAFEGSEVNISGGVVAPDFRANAGSDVELFGGEFQLNGVNFTGDTITLGNHDVFAGTLADGSTFIFNRMNPLGDDLQGVTLTHATLPTLESSPMIINSPITNGPSGLRGGQTLTVLSGGVLPSHFAAVDATLNIEGGIVGAGLEVAGSTVNISGGTVGDFFQAYDSEVNISGGDVGRLSSHPGSIVNLTDGTVSRLWSFAPTKQVVVNISGEAVIGDFDAYNGSIVNMSGGTIEGRFGAIGDVINISGGLVRGSLSVNNNTIVNLSGGTIGGNLTTTSSPGTQVNISGGRVEGDLTFRSDIGINLFGSRFFLDGIALDELQVNEAFAIADREVNLSGLLADGSAFSFYLNSRSLLLGDYFSPNATLTVTLVVPEPASLGLAMLAYSMLLYLRPTSSFRA